MTVSVSVTRAAGTLPARDGRIGLLPSRVWIYDRRSALKPATPCADGRPVVPAATTTPRIRARIQRPAPDAVVEWRFDELERAGVEVLEAFCLALVPAFDIAALRGLVGRGCPPALAVSILR